MPRLGFLTFLRKFREIPKERNRCHRCQDRTSALGYRGLYGSRIRTWETDEADGSTSSDSPRWEDGPSDGERVETHSKAKGAALLPIRWPPLSIYQYTVYPVSDAKTPADHVEIFT